ncbi:50S ribosomal protein L25/general stress protein Ctc [Alphaproteobacteria bacterium]|jgi:large subunit ribosomal protein L25|nr:50S ribosomal protein L25/general stress protein Ctc [Alphaproteobacteria bacterium]MDC0968633.1 50S ribosomal protein L25/general stress protein Ctc [Alphaproteobacteria bacterium]|tara:strand:- start:136 stop:777 length:642 start_codon:yes stop_codon:yes gene_type:complete
MKISGNIPAKERKKGNTNPYLNDGFIPSIIYGGKADPLMVAVETIQLKKRFEEGGFYSKIFEIEIGDKKEAVVVKSIQRHKVKNNPIHVDFQRVDEKTRIVISVPVEFSNQELSPGLKQGGVLNVVRRDLELSCLANNIPENFEISLEGKEVGDDIRLSSITLGEGMKPTILGRDFMLATIQAPKVEKEPEAVAEEATEEAETEEKKEEKAAE